MSINNQLNGLLEQLLLVPSEVISNEQLVHCLDLTFLTQDNQSEQLTILNNSANTHEVAAVCVYPKDLEHFKLKDGIKLATVVNFPQGNDNLTTCLAQIEQSLTHGAQEIDYVVPYSLYLEGKKYQALEHAEKIVQYCKEHKLCSKIILESGAFTDLEALYELANELIAMDVDFLKTSTGKIAQGASLSTVFTLLSAIKDSGKNTGIKVSGGIKTPFQAKNYAHLAQLVLNQKIDMHWFRIGASTLLDELLKTN